MARKKRSTRSAPNRGQKGKPSSPSPKGLPGQRSVQSRVARVISKMRNSRISLHRAAREIGITPRTVIRHAASAMKKTGTGKYITKQSDRVHRTLLIPMASGPQELTIRNSRDASSLGSYWAALQKYYETGATSQLNQFKDQFITDVNGKRYPLITDLEILNRLGSAGAVSFESIYAWSAQ